MMPDWTVEATLNAKFQTMDKPKVTTERLGLRWAVYIQHPPDQRKRILCSSAKSFSWRKMARLASDVQAQVYTGIWIGLRQGFVP
jgi:hypothetical protein